MPRHVPHHRPRRVAPLALLLLAVAAGCRSTKEPDEREAAGLTAHERALAEMEFKLPSSDARFTATTTDKASVGELLAEIDKRARIWNNLKLTARTPADDHRLSAVEREAAEITRRHLGALIEELQYGPTRNRTIAAMGLGFSREPAALGPLIGALLDRDEDVVENALLALGYLASPDTPLAPLARILETNPNDRLRNNAAYAIQRAVSVGARDPAALPALRGALTDPEPGVRGAAAISLSVVGDAESVDAIGDLLSDRVAFPALAAATALSRLGKQVPNARARAARHLTDAFVRSTGSRRRSLQRELIVLSGRNFGDDDQAWREWALRVQ